MRLLLATTCLLACGGDGLPAPPGTDWPWSLTLSAQPVAVSGPRRCAALTTSGRLRHLGTRSVQPVSEVVLWPEGAASRIDLGDETWVEGAPLGADARALLLGLREEGDECGVRVRPFADGDRVIVHSSLGVQAVQLSTERVRMLDHRSAMLEGCRMRPGRQRYVCSLDLGFGEVAEFDPDGVELRGSFRPAWR